MPLFLKALPLMALRHRPSFFVLCSVSSTIPRVISRTRYVSSVSASTSPSIQPAPPSASGIVEVLEIVGISMEQAESKFGYLLEVLDMGAPPHGGIAHGLDKLVLLSAGANSIRDVIAFPKTTTGQYALTRSPSEVDPQQLKDLSITSLQGG